jgi:ATP-dependent RNA helicase DeaD
MVESPARLASICILPEGGHIMTQTIETFADLNLSAALLTALAEVGYETPSPIQAACIPHLLAGRDLLGEAQTGTGKTAAFALPLLNGLDLANRNPQVLVLTPTRELAIQVAEAFQKYAKYLRDFHVLPIYGGQSMVVQLRQLSRGVHVIVGTPGRVMDHLERKSLALGSLKALVLDEADEMLRMGFIDDVEWILEHTPATRQTALFSATMPDVIRRVAHRHLREPQEVKIRNATTTVAAIRQRYLQVRAFDKLDALTRILEVEENFDAALVFVRTKTATVELADKLEARGYSVAALNGDMTQGLREQVIERFKSGSVDIVVATDVAARGIDVPRISHVINYDVPYDTESYVHRIGRTGRAGRAGNAILFVEPREIRMLRAIERATRQPIETIALPTREAVADRRVAQFKQQVIDVLENEKLDFFFDVVRQMEEEGDFNGRQLAAGLAFMAQREKPLQLDPSARQPDPAPRAARSETRPDSRSESRFESRPESRPSLPPEYRPEYRRESRPESRSELRHELTPAHDKPPRENREEILARRRSFSEGALQRYRIEVGRNQGATPKDIVGAIANEGGIEGRQIGQINLFDDYSTVELPPLPDDLLSTLKRTRVRQVALNIRLAVVGEGDAPVERAKPKWEKERPPPGKWSTEVKAGKPPFKADPGKAPFRGEKTFGSSKPAATPRPAFASKAKKRPG